jgi:hypothetical protein
LTLQDELVETKTAGCERHTTAIQTADIARSPIRAARRSIEKHRDVYGDEIQALLAVVARHDLELNDLLDYYFKTPGKLADILTEDFGKQSDYIKFKQTEAVAAKALYDATKK